MGATDIAVQGAGKTMQDAFHRLVEQSKREDGDDPYSGCFNTISDYYDLTERWRGSGLEAGAFLNQEELMDQLDTRAVNGVCLQAPTGQQEGKYLFVGWAAV